MRPQRASVLLPLLLCALLCFQAPLVDNDHDRDGPQPVVPCYVVHGSHHTQLPPEVESPAASPVAVVVFTVPMQHWPLAHLLRWHRSVIGDPP